MFGQLSIFRGCQILAEATYDPENHDSLVAVLVEAIATARGIDPMELPPLADWVDLDAFTAVLANSKTADLTLAMSIDELNIFVNARGEIQVCDATQETAPTPVFAVESDGTPQAG